MVTPAAGTKLKQLTNPTMSSYRDTTFLLTHDQPTELQFYETEPNHAIIFNTTAGDLYISSKRNVSADVGRYELYIPAGQTKIYTTPAGFKNLYGFNVDATNEQIRVISFVDAFDPNLVDRTQTTVVVSKTTGSVDVTSLPELPAGTKTIGNVTVNGGVAITGQTIPDSQALPTRGAGMAGFATNSLTVPGTSVEAKAGATPLTNRKQLIIYPPNAGTVYWGSNSSVTSATGAPLAAGAAPISFDLDPNNYVGVWLIGDGTSQTVTIVEQN